MCEVPARRISSALQPSRIVLTVLAVGLVVVGILLHDLMGLVLLGLGSVALLAAVAFPVIKQVEFGFPMGVRVSTALRDRDGELQLAFTQQRGDLGLYTQLMCDDPALASRLLEAAWARTAAAWRGPVTPDLRSYVLCEFVQLLSKQSRWNSSPGDPTSAGARAEPATALSELPPAARIAVVLREFAGLPVAQIASMTNQPINAVATSLRSADERLARFDAANDDS